MADQVHLGHIFHLAGSPKVTEAAAALVSIPDGALVIGDDGTIVYCGERGDLPDEYQSATVICCRASSTPTSTFRRLTPTTPTAAVNCWSG